MDEVNADVMPPLATAFEFRNSLERARRGGCRMTGEAARRQGGYLLPLCSFDERSVSRETRRTIVKPRNIRKIKRKRGHHHRCY